MKEYDPEHSEKALANIDPIYRGIGPTLGQPTGSRSITSRSDDRAEFELFRPIRNVPKAQRDIIQVCYNAYERVDILRNVIDMMSSFGCQGIQIVHPVKSRERLYKAWWDRVGGSERSERFLNGLYAAGNVVIKKTFVKLSSADIRDLQRSVADADADYERLTRVGKNEIPIEYTFLNPATIETAGGDLATFLGHPTYILMIPNFIISMIRSPKTSDQSQIVNDLPAYIRDAVKSGERSVKLDNDKLAVYHYMKPDWRQWAMPMTYSILQDVILYEQMKMADYSALQGIISHIRIWKLGNLHEKIQVGEAMYKKLHDTLSYIPTGGPLDLIWDAAIELEETKTDISAILGSEKYQPVLTSLYAGLGIPQSLTGGSSSGGAGFTNNAISLKTLIERLQYGRQLLTNFWNNELRILKEAFGDSKPAQVVFDNMSLYDEASEKMLWFSLYDRHLVDDETIQEKFGLIPEVVAMRIRRDEKARGNGKKPPKATPFHDPQTDHELNKIALQQGTVAPTEVGVQKKPKQAGDKSVLDFKAENFEKKSLIQLDNKKKGVPGQGRPKNSKDNKPRKQRTPKPSVKASLDILQVQQWARETQLAIAKLVNPSYLESHGKRNLRLLTTAETEELESIKFGVLCSLKPFSSFEAVSNAVSNPLPISPDVGDAYKSLVTSHIDRRGVSPSIDEQRDMQASAYAVYMVMSQEAK